MKMQLIKFQTLEHIGDIEIDLIPDKGEVLLFDAKLFEVTKRYFSINKIVLVIRELRQQERDEVKSIIALLE